MTSPERHHIRSVNDECRVLRAVLNHPQWACIVEALDKYASGEKSDLVTLGIVSQGVLVLDQHRRSALQRGAS